ncbi:alpha/beta hydrolase [Pelomonas sp. SE-A7]|uniref:alpha/beta fold hydrolase n=1 Tax=Pelomonas sp. SE-A7 TaxID=3054953 RepID=UPI00259CDF59|nr:alpha/beta hydrolase [Pelomonas sp. SE-A7]MDM4764680.1 alpha/beta hydrolase [Pelomonas sp. SE-A7]
MLPFADQHQAIDAGMPSVTWVLLRGLTRTGGSWGDFPNVFVKEMARLQPGARVLVLDLPGHGALRRQTSPSSIAALVDACRAELKRLGVISPVHLLAMSLGVLVVSDWVARYPEEVGAAVLVNARLRPFTPMLRRLKPLEFLQLLGLGPSTPEVRLSAPPPNRRPRIGFGTTCRQLLAAATFKASHAKPQAPMLLLCSLGDGMVDWRCSQTLSRTWGVPLRMHTAAGHELPLDDAPWVANAVSEWISQRILHG